MNAKRVRAAEGVIFAAQKTKLTAAGIAASLEAACMLQSPESAAELVALREENTALHALVAQLGARAEQRHLMDPLDHVLEHLADERPVKCGCGHTARTHRPGGCIADAIHSGLLGLCGCTAEVTA